MRIKRRENKDLSIVMPCLNEEKTVGKCIDDAFDFIFENHLKGEVIVVDNGSTDASVKIAVKHGAKVIPERRRGYGRAVRTGLINSSGKVVIMGDCDTTYDLYRIHDLYKMLSSGNYDVVIGDRFAGGIEKNAMPFSHKLGAGVLSFIAGRVFKTDVRDFHCGLRGFTREALLKMTLRTTGMEFATETVAEAVRQNLCIGQLPVRLRRCRCDRRSKLRAVRDGMRHLRFILRRGK